MECPIGSTVLQTEDNSELLSNSDTLNSRVLADMTSIFSDILLSIKIHDCIRPVRRVGATSRNAKIVVKFELDSNTSHAAKMLDDQTKNQP